MTEVVSELRVGAWNALNAFGDEALDERRLFDAVAFVETMDADVLAVPETARHGLHDPVIERQNLAQVQGLMAALGYEGVITDYGEADGRNAHYLSLWSRVGSLLPCSREYGTRRGAYMQVRPLGLHVYGVHFDDRSPAKRITSAKAIADDLGVTSQAIVLGDINEVYSDDPHGRLLRTLGRLGVSRIEVKEYYNSSKRLQRTLGIAARLCRMTAGHALAVLRDAGFRDADPARQPTFGRYPFKLQLDHLLGTSGLEFSAFTVHQPPTRFDGRPLSDHRGITAMVRRSRPAPAPIRSVTAARGK
ncbi:MAG TPA: endonuclease/exonuclease/phosphatase family protein [Candidatus Saccharimonadales bacterium]|nr:endonuclease/exonuclease/phosphatase family protein [Candidatus Saccharimonadales bacterium]